MTTTDRLWNALDAAHRAAALAAERQGRALARRRAAALRLVEAGVPRAEIADRLGVTGAIVGRDVKQAQDESARAG